MPDQTTYIGQAEGTGGLLPYFSYPEIFRGRSVIHFIDNTYVLSAFVHGYASKPDMARIVSALQVATTALDCRVWFEWVPSKASIADLPSRLLYSEYFSIAPNSAWVRPVVPDVSTWTGPLTAIASLLP